MPAGSNARHLSEIAQQFDLTLRGEDAPVDGVGTLRAATASQISFLANPGYRPHLPETRAAAVILRAEDASACPTRCLVSDDPYLSFARVAGLFETERELPAGIHPSASVDPAAEISAHVRIGAQAVVAAGCRIGAGSWIGPGSVIEAGSTLGRNCRVFANVSIGHGVRIGNRVIIHPGVVIGADGFGIAMAGERWKKVPQLGTVVIGDDCEIGANTTIDRGAMEDTVLEEDVRVDNLVQIAHNVRIGAHSAIAAMSGIAGSARIGRYCMLAGGAGINGHVDVADRVTVGARSALMESVDESGATWSSTLPAQPIKQWQRNLALLRRLGDIWRRLRRLEKQPKTKEAQSE